MLKKSTHILSVLVLGVCSVFNQGFSEERILSWGILEEIYDTTIQPKKRLMLSLLQENIRYKTEQFLLNLEIPYEVHLKERPLPCQFSISFNEKELEKIKELKMLLIKKDSYFLEEFEIVKSIRQKLLQEEKNIHQNYSFLDFLENSERFLEEISQEDLIELFQNYDFESIFDPQKPCIDSKKMELEKFLMISLNKEEKFIIRQLIVDFIDKNMDQLMSDRGYLESAKLKMNSIHPLIIVGFIFSDLHLQQCLRVILESEMKSCLFLLILDHQLEKIKESGFLAQHLSALANFLNRDQNEIEYYINQEDYKGLVRYLLQI